MILISFAMSNFFFFPDLSSSASVFVAPPVSLSSSPLSVVVIVFVVVVVVSKMTVDVGVFPKVICPKLLVFSNTVVNAAEIVVVSSIASVDALTISVVAKRVVATGTVALIVVTIMFEDVGSFDDTLAASL